MPNENKGRLNIAFLIRSLDYGGAQRQLTNLAKGLVKREHEVNVLSFYPGGPFAEELASSGVRHVPLNKRGRWDLVGFRHRLGTTLRRIEPDVLLSYLDVPNIMAVSVRNSAPKTKIVWGVRISEIDLSHYDLWASVTFKLERLLSGVADLIIANSNSGRELFLAKGFPKDRLVVIPNGIDTETFKPDREARAKLRASWQIPAAAKLIGMVGRLDPMKDCAGFLQAAKLVRKRRDDVWFVCVGDGPESYATSLRRLAADLNVADRVLWPGARFDMPAVLNSFDIMVSSSRAEGFPNVIGEAMACGVPCVVTDVGDSAWIVADTGAVVPAKNPTALADAILVRLESKHSEGCQVARARIIDCFSVQQLTLRTEAELLRLVRGS